MFGIFVRKHTQSPIRGHGNFLKLTVESLEERTLPSVDMGPFVNPTNGHTYYRLGPSTWTEAEAEAISLGGHLVTINDAAENDWVSSKFGDSKLWGLWIGLNDVATEGNFVWSSGETSNYRNWSPTYGQPDNFNDEDYVHLWNPAIGAGNSGWAWNDYVNWTYATPPNSYPSHGVVEINTKVDLIATSLAWNGSKGGVDVGYKIDGADLTKAATGGLFWSADDKFDAGDTPAYSFPLESKQGDHGLFVGNGDLAAKPNAAPYLILALDATNVVDEKTESNNVAVTALPSIFVEVLPISNPTMGMEYSLQARVTNNSNTPQVINIEAEEKYISVGVNWKPSQPKKPWSGGILLSPGETRVVTIGKFKRAWDWLPKNSPTIPSQTKDEVYAQTAQAIPGLLNELLGIMGKVKTKEIMGKVSDAFAHINLMLDLELLSLEVHPSAQINYVVRARQSNGEIVYSHTTPVVLQVSENQRSHFNKHLMYYVLAERFQTGIGFLDLVLKDVFQTLAKLEYKLAQQIT